MPIISDSVKFPARVTAASPLVLDIAGADYRFSVDTDALSLIINELNGVVNVLDYCSEALVADITANDFAIGASSSIQLAIDDLPSSGGVLLFPNGGYLIDSVINIPSNVEVRGSGPACVLKMSASMAANPNQYPGALGVRNLFANSDFSLGNSNIYIHDFVIDSSNMGELHHPITFYNAEHFRVERNKFIGSTTKRATQLAALNSSHFEFLGNTFVVQNNGQTGEGAAIAVWDGVHDFTINDNDCDCGSQAAYGIQVNGISTALTANTSHSGVIHGNRIANARVFGIDVSGLWNGSVPSPVYGVVKNISINGNVVTNVSANYGIRVTDGEQISIVANIIENIAQAGIVISSANTGAASNFIVANNIIKDVSMLSPGSFAAIQAGNSGGIDTATKTLISGNIIVGSTHNYALILNPGALDTFVSSAFMAAGTIGVISDAGVRTNKFFLNDNMLSSQTSTKPDFVIKNSTDDALSCSYSFQKDRAGGIVAVSDVLGNIIWKGYDGAVFRESAKISAHVDSASLGSVIGHLALWAGGVASFQVYKTVVISTVQHNFAAPSTVNPSIILPHGTAPTAPANGSFYTTTAGLFGQISGALKQFATLSDAQTWTALQTFNSGININGGTLTSSVPTTITQAWNNAGVTFIGFGIDITDTASAPGSQPFRIRVGGTPVFYVDKLGGTNAYTLSVSGFLLAPAIYGGAGVGSTLALYSTAGAGTTDAINLYTGTQVLRWKVNTSGHLLAGADNSYDIGATGATRPRNVFVAGNITIGDATALVKSSVAMNNGAGAGAGTITNAPAAGNPTKWIPINDNGTTRYVPAW